MLCRVCVQRDGPDRSVSSLTLEPEMVDLVVTGAHDYGGRHMVHHDWSQ